MANKKPVLDKLARNLQQIGLTVVRGASDVVVAGLTITYVDAAIQAPMGGVSDASSPFLGIGVAAPGVIKIKGDTGENSIAAIMAGADELKVLAFCSHFANDVVVEAGDTATELARIPGTADLRMMGS